MTNGGNDMGMTPQEITYVRGFWEELEQAAAALRGSALPDLREEDFFLFQRTGNRLVYENAYFGRRKHLTVFGILAEFGKRQEDIDALAAVMEAVCEERFWALPAHVDFNALDETTIDLFAAETAQTLAELLVIFGETFPKELVEKVQREILRRVLTPFCTLAAPYSWWETDRCNWSAVCAGSVGIAAIYMDRMGKLPKEWKEPCIRRVCGAMKCYLGGMEEDGACTEGLGYFSYGMSYYTAFAELLYEESGQSVDLMARPKCGRIAAFQEKCYFGGGVSVSFSDGSDRERFLPGLTAFLAHKFNGIRTPDYAAARGLEQDACYRWLTNERNIRWLMRYGGQTGANTREPSYNLLSSAQWMICKDRNGNGMAAKGGHNDENHNHNDVGHFLCVFRGEMLLTDLGAGEYTREYFSDKRYDILCNRSLGHSVPLINGCEQCAGREYRAERFVWEEAARMLRISFAAAYPQGLVQELERTIFFSAERMAQEDAMWMVVTDRFVPSEQTRSFTENLVTPFPVSVEENDNDTCVIKIQGQHGFCRIRTANVSDLRIIPKEHRLHDGARTTVNLIQWEPSDGVQAVRMEISCG
ncbi:MAG: heparinase II/III-family protein [Roseburia sp.]|nr:heparinase II/III-family protein [Roseburia sp.]